EVSRGIELHVGCGPAAKAEISGAPQDVSDTTTEVSGHTLKISRTGTFSGHHDSVKVRLTAPQPLVGISANTGVAAEVEACAVSTDHLDISANTGVTLDLAGSTGRVVIDANTGARIQPLDTKRFDAKEAKVSANTGAEIRLCSVEHIDGNAALGANIVADSKSGTVRTNMGASFSVESCK
ncbi:MAG TPA: DUF2807 domain-containing protein, partial [Magnetospirillaceae bacterium]|nr:DUF2807 domain-containing protein [Magnetospirillaceae bacterium]